MLVECLDAEQLANLAKLKKDNKEKSKLIGKNIYCIFPNEIFLDCNING